MADDEVTPFGTPTTNYGWTKPSVGGDVDAWGGYINTDLDGIDSTIKSVSTVANVAMNDNLVINGNFAVNQRGQVSGTALATTIYGHDRWKAGASGCTYTFPATLPDATITITAGTLAQVIEAGMIAGGVYALSWTGTAQARVYQGSPTGSYVASPIITASLTAGTNTIVEFNTGTVVKVKFESGSVVTPFNRQSLAKSMVDCQRYYQIGNIFSNGINYGTAAGIAVTRPLIVAMRASPTLVSLQNSATNITSITLNAISAQDMYINGSMGVNVGVSFNNVFSASAEL